MNSGCFLLTFHPVGLTYDSVFISLNLTFSKPQHALQGMLERPNGVSSLIVLRVNAVSTKHSILSASLLTPYIPPSAQACHFLSATPL